MRLPRVYVAVPLSIDTTVELETATGHYLTRVLRLQANARVTVFNGSGGEYQAIISAASKRSVSLLIESYKDQNTDSPLSTRLGIGVSRGERMDWVIQKATELGVTEIIPLMCERTTVKLSGERLERRMSHWQKIAISACEQSGRNHLPVIQPPVTVDQWTSSCAAHTKWLLHPGEKMSGQLPDSPETIALMIGPEGGFGDAEIEIAKGAGFSALSLGPRVLRTETAPIAALSIIQYLWGDLC
jgi:16S rRNA (uracil1498-N3)-methyltransferase